MKYSLIIENYLLGALHNNKDEFSNSQDIEETIGALLQELADGQDVNITELCDQFYHMLKE